SLTTTIVCHFIVVPFVLNRQAASLLDPRRVGFSPPSRRGLLFAILIEARKKPRQAAFPQESPSASCDDLHRFAGAGVPEIQTVLVRYLSFFINCVALYTALFCAENHNNLT
ncbi:hypothetical protein, partial [Cardiobacterium hominis]|uniref:hypothetical protein n=1 Tax=Cardiobacterium hominis TaxID=2718 RepID=UPI0028E31DFF